MQYRVTVRKEGAPDDVQTIDAESRFVVYEQVQKNGGTVIDLAEVAAAYTIPPWVKQLTERKIKHLTITHMVKNLSAMLAAGLSLSRALSVVQKESDNAHLQLITAELSDMVAKGSPFHEGLAQYPHIFPEVLVSMVKVGEESGSLAESLNIVGLQMERSEELSRKIKGAFIYPTIVLFAIAVVSVLMLLYVVPTLAKTFADLHVELPLATRVFVGVSNFMVEHVILVLLGLALLGAGGVSFVRSTRGHAFMIWAGLYVPVISELIRETYAARTARTLSSLLSAGVPVLEAIAITKDVVHAAIFADILEEASALVKKGDPLSRAFAAHPKTYPILMSEMLAVGEETGQVAPMLKQVAEFYEGDVSQKTKDLSTIIEPVLMLLIGAVVGIFAVAMIAPIYSLSSSI
ncbi:MAG: type II secretion system F family protein [Candidatus Paceibacterota bacterium]